MLSFDSNPEKNRIARFGKVKTGFALIEERQKFFDQILADERGIGAIPLNSALLAGNHISALALNQLTPESVVMQRRVLRGFVRQTIDSMKLPVTTEVFSPFVGIKDNILFYRILSELRLKNRRFVAPYEGHRGGYKFEECQDSVVTIFTFYKYIAAEERKGYRVSLDVRFSPEATKGLADPSLHRDTFLFSLLSRSYCEAATKFNSNAQNSQAIAGIVIERSGAGEYECYNKTLGIKANIALSCDSRGSLKAAVLDIERYKRNNS